MIGTVGVAVWVGVRVVVGEAVGVWVTVGEVVGVRVVVGEAVGVSVAVLVIVAVGDGVTVMVGVTEAVGVTVIVGVTEAVGVTVMVGVTDAVGVTVIVGVTVGCTGRSDTGVLIGVTVGEGGSVGRLVDVGRGVEVGRRSGVLVAVTTVSVDGNSGSGAGWTRAVAVGGGVGGIDGPDGRDGTIESTGSVIAVAVTLNSGGTLVGLLPAAEDAPPLAGMGVMVGLLVARVGLLPFRGVSPACRSATVVVVEVAVAPGVPVDWPVAVRDGDAAAPELVGVCCTSCFSWVTRSRSLWRAVCCCGSRVIFSLATSIVVSAVARS